MNELLVMAEIAGRRCALSALEVQSVIDVGEITPIPRAPAYVAGLAALRSQALTVLDCRAAIGLDPAGYATDERAAVVRVEGHTYALKVDLIDDVATTQGAPALLPGGFGPLWDRVARGMVETDRGPVLLLDLPALIAGPAAARAAA
ncbi:MAG: chemotaxis protein CheW [Erythrobacter sp.]